MGGVEVLSGDAGSRNDDPIKAVIESALLSCGDSKSYTFHCEESDGKCTHSQRHSLPVLGSIAQCQFLRSFGRSAGLTERNSDGLLAIGDSRPFL